MISLTIIIFILRLQVYAYFTSYPNYPTLKEYLLKSFPKQNLQLHIFNYLNKTKHQIVFQKENLTLIRIFQNKEGRLFRETSLSYYIGILNLVLEQDLDFLYGRPERLTSLNLVFDRLTSMQDRRMVFLSYDLSNMGKRGVRIFLRQIHRDLTGLHDLTFTELVWITDCSKLKYLQTIS